MPNLLLREIPKYECLIEAVRQFPEVEPSALEAYLHLLRAGDAGFRVTQDHLQAQGMSRSRFVVLMLLTKHEGEAACGGEGMSPANLAELVGVTRAAMTGVVDALEKEGLVFRKHSLDDRRMLTVHLTPEGESKLQNLLPEHFRLISRIMATLSESERKTLVKLVEKVAAAADEIVPPREETSMPND